MFALSEVAVCERNTNTVSRSSDQYLRRSVISDRSEEHLLSCKRLPQRLDRYRGNAVPSWKATQEGSAPLERGTDARGRSVELSSDGAAGGGHEGLQESREENADVHRHPRHRRRTLPAHKQMLGVTRTRLVDLNVLVSVSRDVQNALQSVPDPAQSTDTAREPGSSRGELVPNQSLPSWTEEEHRRHRALEELTHKHPRPEKRAQGGGRVGRSARRLRGSPSAPPGPQTPLRHGSWRTWCPRSSGTLHTETGANRNVSEEAASEAAMKQKRPNRIRRNLILFVTRLIELERSLANKGKRGFRAENPCRPPGGNQQLMRFRQSASITIFRPDEESTLI
ncbi:hypothetical protein DNTS_020801 [Danionella cerebrum]|uniref:Uncharacterized protein n=1 Tax=Danionella cerebrum TaxID=2873325 RepID=A0A553RE74_9TELE|nr:hypothetical protein DNTS_020801 [Danionella translucida]